jgi:S-adenosylmethionine:tRNA ribosyltransferase-isomerase
MTPATHRQSSAELRRARLLVVDAWGHLRHESHDRFVNLLRRGDLVVANDAATLPASLHGTHLRTGQPIEVRLAGRHSLEADDVTQFAAVLFGAGDFHTPTEHRPLPPELASGDRLMLGPLAATVVATLGHPRLAVVRFEGSPDEIWAGLARHGRPIQYAHIDRPLAMWDVWTSIAGRPVAFEAPSASFVLDWRMLNAIRARGVEFATITHAAGISSTGDEALDARLPFDEPFDISAAAAQAITRAQSRGRRIIAVGTTVVRALESAAGPLGGVEPGPGTAIERFGPLTALRVVDAILTGVHEPGTSHYELLRAFTDEATLQSAHGHLRARDYRTHEFGDFMFIEKAIDVASGFSRTMKARDVVSGFSRTRTMGERLAVGFELVEPELVQSGSGVGLPADQP